MGYIGTGSGNLTSYASGTGAWGSSPSGSSQAAVSSSSYASGSFGYGTGENGYGSNMGSYAGRNAGYGVGTVPYGSATGGYGGGYADVYNSLEYVDNTWRARTTELGGNALVGYLGNAVADGSANGSGSNMRGNGVASRQTPRGVAV